MDMATSYDGLYLCTIADDYSLKVFDVVNFGMSSQLCECCMCGFFMRQDFANGIGGEKSQFYFHKFDKIVCGRYPTRLYAILC